MRIPPSSDLPFPTREECVVPDLLAARAAADPDKLFVLFEEERWTRAQAVPIPAPAKSSTPYARTSSRIPSAHPSS